MVHLTAGFYSDSLNRPSPDEVISMPPIVGFSLNISRLPLLAGFFTVVNKIIKMSYPDRLCHRGL